MLNLFLVTRFKILVAYIDFWLFALTGDTRKIFVSKTVDESHSARVLIGCKPIIIVCAVQAINNEIPII